MSTVASKSCSKCGRAKELRGKKWVCPPCASAYHREYYARHRNDLAASNRENYRQNRDAYIARAAAWKHANPTRRKELDDAHYQRSREYRRTQQAIKYAADPVAYMAVSERWRQANPESRRRDNLRRRARLANAVCEHGTDCVTTEFLKVLYASTCAYCGAPAEHADHFFPIATGGLHCVENLRPACGPCNGSKAARDPFEWIASRS